MKIPIRATQNKQRGRQFDMPALGIRGFQSPLLFSLAEKYDSHVLTNQQK